MVSTFNSVFSRRWLGHLQPTLSITYPQSIQGTTCDGRGALDFSPSATYWPGLCFQQNLVLTTSITENVHETEYCYRFVTGRDYLPCVFWRLLKPERGREVRAKPDKRWEHSSRANADGSIPSL